MDAVELTSIHRHPLIPKELFSGKGSRVCGLCGEDLHGAVYECSQCNFTAHIGCADNPPSLVIDGGKIHEHTLTLLASPISFICNACGLSGDRSSYVCLKCSFLIHKECIDLPRVIKVSRHQHRIVHTLFLGHGEWDCRICHEKIDGQYGAYSCGLCHDFVVHSKCATKVSVWDGKELEGIPEEDDEIEAKELLSFVPCEEDKKLILHFSHQHSLRLEDGDVVHDRCCSACALSIASEPFYKCVECEFFLHQECANLPRKKTTFLHVHPLTLCTDNRSGPTIAECQACLLLFNGFKYRCLKCEDDVEFDIGCCSVSEPLQCHLHTHPLFFTLPTNEIDHTDKICEACNRFEEPNRILSCISCDFNLCFECATLPSEVKYKYDEHTLSHTIVKDGKSDVYWCDLCEKRVNEKINHYKCSDCGPVLHTECLLGSFRNMRPGLKIAALNGQEHQVVLNDRKLRLCCSQCHGDCHEPLLLMISITTDVTIYLCSSICFGTYVETCSSVS